MIEGQVILEEFYQVKSTGEYHWYGVDSDIKEEQAWKDERMIEIAPHDILVRSSNGKYFNRLNRTRAVNVDIPNIDVKLVNKKIVINNILYEGGYV
jgi:hypothetical protein